MGILCLYDDEVELYICQGAKKCYVIYVVNLGMNSYISPLGTVDIARSEKLSFNYLLDWVRPRASKPQAI